MADFDKIKGARKEDSEYRPGVVTVTAYDGSQRESELKVKTRGKFILKTCRFPPLRLNLPKGSLGGTVCDGQKKIKLVTHCRDGEGDEQNLLKEYLVYRTYNLITGRSLRIRLVRITYVDTSGDDDSITRFAFCIEEEDAIAERLGGIILHINQVHPKHLSARESARMAVFQYMVGNTDWSMISFHNVELLRTAEGVHVPVPYDFDWAGFVAPSYAKPDASASTSDRSATGYTGGSAGPTWISPTSTLSSRISALTSRRSTRRWTDSTRTSSRMPSATCVTSTRSLAQRDKPNDGSRIPAARLDPLGVRVHPFRLIRVCVAVMSPSAASSSYGQRWGGRGASKYLRVAQPGSCSGRLPGVSPSGPLHDSSIPCCRPSRRARSPRLPS